MPSIPAPARLSLCLVLCGVGLGCDGSAQPSAPGGTNLSQATGQSPSGGELEVKVILNHAPRVRSMYSSDGRLETDVPVDLTVTAEDPDGDSLTYEWTSSCPGTFARTDGEGATFTPRVPAGFTECSVEVDVSDGHGGVGKGILVLTTVRPTIHVAPRISGGYQSEDIVGEGEVVVLHATATGHEGSTLVWDWTAEAGALSSQVDDAQSSDVHWTAPASLGETFKVVATATDPESGRVTLTFLVKVRP